MPAISELFGLDGETEEERAKREAASGATDASAVVRELFGSDAASSGVPFSERLAATGTTSENVDDRRQRFGTLPRLSGAVTAEDRYRALQSEKKLYAAGPPEPPSQLSIDAGFENLKAFTKKRPRWQSIP